MTTSLTSFLTHNLTPFQELWHHLSEEEKISACSVEDAPIISDLADTANNARLVCELHKLYSKSKFIKWQKETQPDKKSSSTHTYHFLNNKTDVLEDNITELFSSLYMVIHVISKQYSLPEDNKSQQKSYITIQKPKIDSILTAIDKSGLNLYTDIEFETKVNLEDPFEVYSFFASYYLQRNLFSHIDSQTLQKFFCKLLAVSFVLKQTLFSFFQRKISFQVTHSSQKTPLSAHREISNKLNNIALYLKSSTTNYLVPSNMKTVSELEGSSSVTPSIPTQNTHSQNSTSKPNNASLRKASGMSSGGEDNTRPSKIGLNMDKVTHSEPNIGKSPKSSVPIGNHNSHDIRDKGTHCLTKEESCPDILGIYDGVSMGDLRINFQVSDLYLCADENEPVVINTANKVNKEIIPVPVYIIGDPHYLHTDKAVGGYPAQPQYYFFPQVHAIHGYALSPLGGFIAPMPMEQPIRKNSYNNADIANMGYSSGFTPRSNRERSPGSPQREISEGGYGGSEGYVGKGIGKDNEKNQSNGKDKQKLKLPPRLKRHRERENEGIN